MCKKASGLKSVHDLPFSWILRLNVSDYGVSYQERGSLGDCWGKDKPIKERPLEAPMK